MTLHMFRCPPATLAGATAGAQVLLDGPEGRHAGRVMRLGEGDSLLLADGLGAGAQARISQVEGDALTCEITSSWVDDEPNPRIVMAQALAKGGRDEAAIEAATELGVDEVIPWQAQRCIVQWKGPRAEKGMEKWRGVVTGAAKQSRRTRDPLVHPVATTSELAQQISQAECAILLHEEAKIPLIQVPMPETGAILIVIGPEGGVPENECHTLTEAGAQLAHLGPHVLRASTAGPAAMAVLNARLRWGVAH